MRSYQATEMIGKQTPEIIHLASEVATRGGELSNETGGQRIEGFDVFVENARRDYYDEREWAYVRKNGSSLIVNLVVTAIRNSSGLITGFLGIATDISEHKKTKMAASS
jgi:PAS domain S-box-containing protein